MTERLSHRLRERAIGRLQRGYVCGSLGTQTFERRLDVALSCESPRALRRVTSDLAPSSLLEELRGWFAAAPTEPESSGLLRCLATNATAVIGRSSSCDFVISDDSVSRRHVMLVRDGDRIVLTDLGSTNGTFLNGRWVTQAEVRPGDRLALGTLDVLL